MSSKHWLANKEKSLLSCIIASICMFSRTKLMIWSVSKHNLIAIAIAGLHIDKEPGKHPAARHRGRCADDSSNIRTLTTAFKLDLILIAGAFSRNQKCAVYSILGGGCRRQIWGDKTIEVFYGQHLCCATVRHPTKKQVRKRLLRKNLKCLLFSAKYNFFLTTFITAILL